jgi:hypothetical protein
MPACTKRAAVGLTDHAAFIHHQHPVLHVLDYQLIDLRQVCEIDFALRHDRLDRDRAFGERVCQPAGGKKSDAQQAGLRIL